VSTGRLEGRVAVVTGSGRANGLGAAIARQLAQEGATLVISDLDGDADGVSDAIVAAGGRASAFACDVSDPEPVRALAAHAAERHGRLDIWVNNAGIGNIMKPLLEVSPDDWKRVIDVNLSGAFFGLQAAAAIMIDQGQGGRIINIASQAAKSGFPFAQAYCSSKHGLVGLVRSAAIELGAHGITVNNVCPNHVTTGLGAWQNEYFAAKTGRSVEQYLADMAARIPMGRPGLPLDTAMAVAFLASDEARYITAESLNVSGGEEPH
jgi:NAD(P)-dependent dehydrogenase (short-subunit alcohol dehydrogenase family)